MAYPRKLYLFSLLIVLANPAAALEASQSSSFSASSASPSPSPTQGPASTAGDSTQLEILDAPKTSYPLEAEEKEIQGQVWVRLHISETGDVEGTEVISGNAILAAEAERTARQWKFKPFIRNGNAVKVSTKVPFDFAFASNVSDKTPHPSSAAETSLNVEATGDSTDQETPAIPRKLRVSAGVAESGLIHRVNPVYPREARLGAIEGDVLLQATIGKDGRIHSLRVVSGPEMLAEASVGAVQQWRYRPYLLNGEPVEIETQIVIKFHTQSR